MARGIAGAGSPLWTAARPSRGPEGLAQYEGLAVTISSLDDFLVRPIPLLKIHELIDDGCLCFYLYHRLYLKTRFLLQFAYSISNTSRPFQ